MKISVEQIKELREETQVSIGEIKKALEEAQGDSQKALKFLAKRGAAVAAKKKKRQAGQGRIEAYIHPGAQIGVLLEIRCETDFVARSEDFKNLAHELALQIAGIGPADVKELLGLPYVRDPQKTVQELIEGVIAKLGENIQVVRFMRFEVGQ
jgi:elongation factor Ts